MAETLTRPGGDATAFLAAVEPEAKRAEAMALDAMFRRATGWEPALWGPSMVGYRRYRYESGREGESLATGFSPRKAEHSIYILPGYQDYGDILARLGKHRVGKACLYIRRFADIDMAALEDLVRAGLRELAARWPVTP